MTLNICMYLNNWRYSVIMQLTPKYNKGDDVLQDVTVKVYDMLDGGFCIYDDTYTEPYRTIAEIKDTMNSPSNIEVKRC